MTANTQYIAIVGPTGSGKSKLAFALAKELNGEIVSCDSVQLYKGFDIGSAKANAFERLEIKHHLLDILNWDEKFDGADYARLAKKSIDDIRLRGKIPIVVGGTGLYLRSLWGTAFHDLPSNPKLKADLKNKTSTDLLAILREKDKASAERIHPNDHFRLVRAVELVLLMGMPVAQAWSEKTDDLNAPKYIFYLKPERKLLCEEIAKRTDSMLTKGWIDEVQNLLKLGCSINAKPMQAIGYKQIVQFLQKKIDYDQMRDKIVVATRQYAKRQVTWFNKVEGTTIFPLAPSVEELKIFLDKILISTCNPLARDT